MLSDREVAIDQFIKITAGGVQIAEYDQILDALVRRYKEVYGDDIDLSSTTADGIFVHDLALIINNILLVFKAMYANLDVRTASGIYLDNLCSLSNVQRKQATQSRAQLELTCDTTTTLASGTIFTDIEGNEWTYNGLDMQIPAGNKATVITVVCKDYGPTKCSAGSITQTLELSNIKVKQVVDGSEGYNEETDASLRARRNQSTGAQGTTVLESLVGALLQIDGIDDAQVINNYTSSTQTAEDGTSINAHSIYVITRTRKNVIVPDDSIANIIYKKLTPGIGTSASSGTQGIAKNVTMTLNNKVDWLKQIISWKEATPIHPEIKLTIIPSINYDKNTSTPKIEQAVIDYLNGIDLSKLPTVNDILITATYADTNTRDGGGYVITDVVLPADFKNENTYFEYDIANCAIDDSVEGKIIVTFK